jgi:ATP-dependent exoDNAse (exonuclease V) beta subunit
MTEPTGGASDQAARRSAVEASGSVLVQAPAGSGKTTLLTQRYLRLLGRVDAPERVLALTFTRRAAEEMRERVIDALAAARSSAPPAHLDRRTWRLAVDALEHLDAAGVDVERHPSRLRIETIDAFNAWLAGRLPIAAGAGSGFKVLSDARPCYQEAAERALAHDEPDRFGAAVHRVLALDDQRWRKLKRVIAEMLASRDRWLPLLGGRLSPSGAPDASQLAAIRRRLDEDLALLVSRVLWRALERLGAERIGALSRLMHFAARNVSATRPQLAAWAADGAPLEARLSDLDRWRGLAALLLTAEGKLRRAVTVREGFPSSCAEKDLMMDLLRELDRDAEVRRILVEIRTLPEPSYSDEQWARALDLAEVLLLAAAELDQVFRSQGAADFAAVSMAALRALGTADGPSDLALELDYRLQHILVDEFQDTSGAQLDLVRMLTAGWQPDDGRSLFCVGDPMQSIYSFRQAEVRAFLELAEDGIGDIHLEVLRLTDNFRSAKPVVDWVNACFGRILPRADDRHRGAIAFRPSVAALGDRPTETSGRGVRLHAYGSRADESAGLADMIADRAARHPAWRIAVLVRAKTHAREIAAALRARGVAFRAVEIEPLRDRAVVRDVITLLSALVHLGDRTAWLALLRAPWAGLMLEDLLRVARGAPVIWDALGSEPVLSALSEDGRARCRRVRATLEAAFALRNETSVARWVERTWLGLGGPSVVGSVEELALARAAFARLAELERGGLPDPADLSDAFADLFGNHGAEGAVEIMTIHKAKGLEFDMVILPSLDRTVRGARDRLLETHQFERTGRDGLAMAARPAIGADKDRLFEFLRYQIRDAARLEAERLLYVACTRAKSLLALSAVVGRIEDPDAEIDEDGPPRRWSPHAGSLLSVLWPAVGADWPLLGPGADQPPRAAAPRGGPMMRVPAGWSVPRLETTPAEHLPAPIVREEMPVFDWATETARRVGILVHAELQRWDSASADAAAIRAREPHFRRWLASHGVPEEHVSAAAARVVAALAAVHEDTRGRWILRSFRDEAREHALSGYSAGGEVARVVFDRTFIDEQGTRWIIDYKTSQHSGSGVEEFLDREVERYRPQLARYASLARELGPQPIRVGLYFPLMRAWREWTP